MGRDTDLDGGCTAADGEGIRRADAAGGQYTVSIDHRYPIPDDEETERQNDMSEVAQQVRSHKSYIDKWQPEASSEAELAQIAREQRMLGTIWSGNFGRNQIASLYPICMWYTD